jgi:hypothetical protein
MHASDVIVTKAGPGTICEALACDLPIILSGYVPGQEGNVTYVEENNVGMLAYDSVELINILRRLLKPVLNYYIRSCENARRISRPRASFNIANCILIFLLLANPVSGRMKRRGPSRVTSTQGFRRTYECIAICVKDRVFGTNACCAVGYDV